MLASETLKKKARDNVERNLGNCQIAEGDTEELRESAYTLAFDKLMDLGVERDTAQSWADEIAGEYNGD